MLLGGDKSAKLKVTGSSGAERTATSCTGGVGSVWERDRGMGALYPTYCVGPMKVQRVAVASDSGSKRTVRHHELTASFSHSNADLTRLWTDVLIKAPYAARKSYGN